MTLDLGVLERSLTHLLLLQTRLTKTESNRSTKNTDEQISPLNGRQTQTKLGNKIF